MKITPYFLLLRPKQWIKNLLVFAVPLASKDIFEFRVFVDCLVAFIAFAMASSSIYAWNDIPLIDIAIISSGFVLRAIAGGLAAGIYISVWFLSVTASASLFIVGAKRYSEILRNSQAEPNRKVLTVYTPTYLRLIWGSCLVSTVTFYALWSAEVQISSDSLLSKYSVIPFLFIFLKYAIYADKGEAESPEVIVFSDRGIQLLAVIWALTFLI
jgi:decaprenyl-phosphate phosphoribosyltransferase